MIGPKKITEKMREEMKPMPASKAMLPVISELTAPSVPKRTTNHISSSRTPTNELAKNLVSIFNLLKVSIHIRVHVPNALRAHKQAVEKLTFEQVNPYTAIV